jgi:hypothetical protein
MASFLSTSKSCSKTLDSIFFMVRESTVIITTANVTVATPISGETLENNNELVDLEGTGILALDSICRVPPLK